MEPKKISFGFSKINKKLNLTANKECFKNESKVELIKCLEGHEIKLVEEKPEVQPLIIPIKESQKTSAALASLIKRRAVLLGEEEQEQTNATENKNKEDNLHNTNGEPEDIEKRAARELLAELQANGLSDQSSNLVLPVVNPDDLPLEGAKESSLDDYESIPIQDFGKAMLRGMGWSEPSVVATGGPRIDESPMVRPKGMGLGADKALKKQPLLVAPESNEVLEIKRNAYVRILGGKHKDMYGQIEGFDDHAGRVIVKMAIGGAKETFNEFLCQPISRKEYAQYGKCINTTKYEEYKKQENEFGQIILKKEDDRKEFKREKGEEDERDHKHEINSNNSKLYKREKDRDEKEYKRENYRERESDRKRDSNRDDVQDRRRDHNDEERYLNKNEKYLSRDNDDRERNTERNRYTSKYDERRVRERDFYKEREKNSYRDYRDKDFNRDTRERHSYKNSRDEERSTKHNDSSVSENDSHSSKHKKSYKIDKNTKKSEKSKKSKSKNDESDSETLLSSSSEEERRKKHKKKTKKSKKQRERSRSR